MVLWLLLHSAVSLKRFDVFPTNREELAAETEGRQMATID
jgi:hypothetical protein